MYKKTGVLVAILFITISLSAFAATLEEILADGKAKLEAVNSATSDMIMTFQVDMEGQRMEMKGSGKTYFLKEDDTEYTRSEMSITMEIPGIGEMTQKMTGITVGDDQLLLMEMMGMKMAMKDVEEEHPYEVHMTNHLADLVEDNILTVMDDAVIDDQAVYVIKAVPKEDTNEEMYGAQILYMSKDTGFPVRIELLDNNEVKIGEINIQNLQTNVDIEKDLFDLSVPEGYMEMNPGALSGMM